jgi:hypothetical protein
MPYSQDIQGLSCPFHCPNCSLELGTYYPLSKRTQPDDGKLEFCLAKLCLLGLEFAQDFENSQAHIRWRGQHIQKRTYENWLAKEKAKHLEFAIGRGPQAHPEEQVEACFTIQSPL